MKRVRLLRSPVRIHYTWILAFVLISWAVSTQFSTETPILLRITYGVAASVLFFLSILLRELVLLTIASYKGLLVERITLFAFGGLRQVNRETTTPSHELLLAVAGILCNLMITGIFYLAYVLISGTDETVIDVLLKWSAFLYFTLSLFHFIPAFPLDGGRILYVILWKALNNSRRTVRIASWIGWIIGLLIALGGIPFLVLTVEKFTGVFLIGIGLIIQNAATHSLRQPDQAQS